MTFRFSSYFNDVGLLFIINGIKLHIILLRLVLKKPIAFASAYVIKNY